MGIRHSQQQDGTLKMRIESRLATTLPTHKTKENDTKSLRDGKYSTLLIQLMKIIKCKCGHEYATKKDNSQCGKCGIRQRTKRRDS